MKISVLCENTAIPPYKSEHGLSLYIETSQHKLLFDCGQSDLFIENAKLAGVDLTKVDTLILSHGHYDHCGGVLAFHQMNPQAKIYIHQNAGDDYYHIENELHKYIGINKNILNLPNINICHGNLKIDDELELIQQISHHHPLLNNHKVLKRRVNDAYENDSFEHEMVLMIHDDINCLCGGCAHNGILNIIESINQPIDMVISGFHLKQKSYSDEDIDYIKNLGNALKKQDALFYSGHCTGPFAYDLLKQIMKDQLQELHTGKIMNTTSEIMLYKVKKQVVELLEHDNSGHGMNHIERVLKLALRFAKEESVDKDLVALIALLHDVDDYKLLGHEQAEKLINAKTFMKNANVPEEIQDKVLNALQKFGYSKSLKGNRPDTIEGKIVSDADMCDALGVNGVLRTFQYSLKNGMPFFDKNIYPIEQLTAEQYTKKVASSSVCHFFEKILKLKNMMMTESGKKEAISRHQIIVEMLYHLFDEEDAPEWKEYLTDYLAKQK